MVNVCGLYRIGLRVPDLDNVAEFYHNNWAMEFAHGDADSRYFRSRGVAHGDLVLKKGEAPALDHVALSVESESDLLSLLSKVESAGHRILESAVRGAHSGEALSAAVQDVDGNRIELVVPSKEHSAHEVSHPAPRHLGHVVLWTGRVDEQEAFYKLLGFQVSDRTHVGMSFLRCNTDHHSVALARSERGKTGLNHVAFDVGSIDEVMRELGRLRSEGVECVWGVGRHGPGNNVFSYYRDPAGNVIEYYGDMEQVDPTKVVETRFWGPQHKGDLWGVAGPPPEIMRD